MPRKKGSGADQESSEEYGAPETTVPPPAPLAF